MLSTGKEWSALADFTRLYPRSEEVQGILREQIAFAREQGMKDIVYVGEQADLQLRLDTIFLESPREPVFFESAADAIQWLLNE